MVICKNCEFKKGIDYPKCKNENYVENIEGSFEFVGGRFIKPHKEYKSCKYLNRYGYCPYFKERKNIFMKFLEYFKIHK